MNNTEINFSEIIEKIYIQLNQVKGLDERFETINFYVDDEQTFIKRENNYDVKSLYIVLKYGEATLNYGSSVIPLTLLIFGVGDKFELTKEFLNKFVSMFNLIKDGQYQYIYSSPYVLSNFNEVGYSFRSLFTINCSVLIKNKGLYYIEKILYEDEEVDVLDFKDDLMIQLNSQPYSNTNGETKSYASMGTYTFSIMLYGVDSKLINDCLDLKYQYTDINKDFMFTIKLKSTSSSYKGFENKAFKLKNFHYEENIGKTPVCSLTFTR